MYIYILYPHAGYYCTLCTSKCLPALTVFQNETCECRAPVFCYQSQPIVFISLEVVIDPNISLSVASEYSSLGFTVVSTQRVVSYCFVLISIHDKVPLHAVSKYWSSVFLIFYSTYIMWIIRRVIISMHEQCQTFTAFYLYTSRGSAFQ